MQKHRLSNFSIVLIFSPFIAIIFEPFMLKIILIISLRHVPDGQLSKHAKLAEADSLISCLNINDQVFK